MNPKPMANTKAKMRLVPMTAGSLETWVGSGTESTKPVGWVGAGALTYDPCGSPTTIRPFEYTQCQLPSQPDQPPAGQPTTGTEPEVFHESLAGS